MRRKRFAEFETKGLAQVDPLRACLSAINADLFEIASEFGRAIKKSRAADASTSGNREHDDADIDSYLRVTRQMDRLIQLDIKVADAQRQADDAKVQLQLLSLRSHLTDATSKGSPPIPSQWE
jgi:hypothetical protein